MTDKLKQFIQDNKNLINENTKDSWEEVYYKIPNEIKGEFTKIILDAGINDPAEIMGYIPEYYLFKSTIQDYKIPDNITSIGDYAFYHCYSLESIEIPDSVTSIGNRAFVRCDSLTSIEIPDSVTSIDDSAFSGCDNLTEIVIPDSVTSIGFRAFENCERLTSVIIPDSVVWIGGCVFSYCYKLKEIQYKGTKKDALTRLKVRNKRWRAISFIERVICTDGEIIL